MKNKFSILILMYYIMFMGSCASAERHYFKIDDFKYTDVYPIVLAIANNDFDKCQKFLETYKGDLNIQETNSKASIVHVAISYRNYEILELILKHGANPNLYDNNGYTPIIYVCDGIVFRKMDNFDSLVLQYVKVLIKYGADVNSKKIIYSNGEYKYQFSALMEVCGRLYIDSFNVQVVDYLVKHGADINYTFTKEYSALISSASFHNFQTTEYLLNQGANYKKDYLQQIDRDSTKLYIQDILKTDFCPFSTIEYFYKKRVIQFLEKNGIDYYGLPVDKDVLEILKRNYPDSWESMSKVY